MVEEVEEAGAAHRDDVIPPEFEGRYGLGVPLDFDAHARKYRLPSVPGDDRRALAVAGPPLAPFHAETMGLEIGLREAPRRLPGVLSGSTEATVPFVLGHVDLPDTWEGPLPSPAQEASKARGMAHHAFAGVARWCAVSRAVEEREEVLAPVLAYWAGEGNPVRTMTVHFHQFGRPS